MTVAAKIIVKQLIQSRNCIRRTLFRNSRCFRFFLDFLMFLNIRDNGVLSEASEIQASAQDNFCRHTEKPDGQDREAEAQEDILRRESCCKAESRIKSKEG